MKHDVLCIAGFGLAAALRESGTCLRFCEWYLRRKRIRCGVTFDSASAQGSFVQVRAFRLSETRSVSDLAEQAWSCRRSRLTLDVA